MWIWSSVKDGICGLYGKGVYGSGSVMVEVEDAVIRQQNIPGFWYEGGLTAVWNIIVYDPEVLYVDGGDRGE